jgi:hypothetical protein
MSDAFHKVVKVGDVFPAAKDPGVKNPGPIQDASGNALDPWLLIRAQDTAYSGNSVLIEEYYNQVERSPAYAEELGEKPSWAVYTAAAEAGGLDFQQQRLGPPVKNIATPSPKS